MAGLESIGRWMFKKVREHVVKARREAKEERSIEELERWKVELKRKKEKRPAERKKHELRYEKADSVIRELTFDGVSSRRAAPRDSTSMAIPCPSMFKQPGSKQP